MPIIEKTFPIRLVSPNVQEHWRVRNRRHKAFELLLRHNLIKDGQIVVLPCRVLLERSGPKIFDFDNFMMSAKKIKDVTASLILGKKNGQDDDNPEIEWIYKQIKGKYALRIQITWGD